MKCSICGGELQFRDGQAICDSCGSTHTIDHFFENVDVFLCYTESDAQGRRTKDSVIAADIYQKLQAKKIDVFYERVSVSDFAGDDAMLMKYSAINKAQVVLVIGTQKEYFENAVAPYSQFLEGKKIVPVLSDMRPEQIPSDYKKLQALNYDSIGADADLVKGVLNLLGRENELETVEFTDKSHKKGKIAIIISVCAVLLAAITGLVFFLTRSPKDEEPPQLTSQQLYDNAQALMDEGKYLEAAKIFDSIKDFKNSKNFIKTIYDRYDGYYQNAELNTLFYINIQDGYTAEIKLQRTLADGKLVRFEESSTVANNVIKVSFVDSQSNKGDIEITLANDGLAIKTVVGEDAKGLSIGNLDLKFSLEQRADKPAEKEITRETILSWMKTRVTLSELKQAGYKVEFHKSMTAGGGTLDNAQAYKIENTDIQLLMMDYDVSKTKKLESIKKTAIDDFAVFGVIAPAELIIPEKVGKDANLFFENNILFYPNVSGFELTSPDASLSPEYTVSFYSLADKIIKIKNNTLVGITSKKLIGEFNYNDLCDKLANDYLIKAVKSKFAAKEKIKDTQYGVDITFVETEGNTKVIGVFSGTSSKISFYKVNIKTLKIQHIKTIDVGYNVESYLDVDSEWQKYKNPVKTTTRVYDEPTTQKETTTEDVPEYTEPTIEVSEETESVDMF